MGRRGPLPEPDNVRALKGLPPRRPVAAAGDRPSPPEWLDALGADYFSDLTAMAPHLRLADSFLLAQLADNLSPRGPLPGGNAQGSAPEGPPRDRAPEPGSLPLAGRRRPRRQAVPRAWLDTIVATASPQLDAMRARRREQLRLLRGASPPEPGPEAEWDYDHPPAPTPPGQMATPERAAYLLGHAAESLRREQERWGKRS